MDTPVISAKDLRKRYRGRPVDALQNISFDLYPGELVAVIGHNGAGKSTLFDIVGGLMPATSGTVQRSVPEHLVGWCPQREIIDWSLTVRQNILLGADLRAGRWNKREAAEPIARLFGLSKYIDRTAETLSGGELRRTQIARALIGDPRLIILDEPTTGLDPDGISVVFSHLRSLADSGASVLVSTHETSRFAHLSTRVLALSEGELIANMPAREFMALGPDKDDLWSAFLAITGTDKESK